ncbi:hypothetical protein [Actinosynnema sp. NPDC023587]|uniref:hypothetical protein n=1 Tax=Actinosynnema sp. NPDC023587 TaxID=3154695 RepID=UPI0033FE93F1
MRSVVLLLFLLALHTIPVTAWAAESRLRDCATEVRDRTGSGRCHGTGTFRVVVACEDGRFARGPWTTAEENPTTSAATCGSRAIGAEVEELVEGSVVGA